MRTPTYAQNKPKIKVGVMGSAGYTGGELLRILCYHPFVDIVFAHSTSQANKAVASIHQDLWGETDLVFTDQMRHDIDVLFLCVGHGEARKICQDNAIPPHVAIIDLSQDFRLQAEGVDGREFVYGLTEWNTPKIKTARAIANPGCFATAIQLALLPLVHKAYVQDVYVVGITGATGAGQSLQTTSHFSWRSNNISAYKTLNHQHLKEIQKTIIQHNPQYANTSIHFVSWRGDFARGIFITAQCQLSLDWATLSHTYHQCYDDKSFVHVVEHAIDLKQVINTNKCLIQIEHQGNTFAIHAAIDNLIKGASGQAVQNMNVMFGLPDYTGLQLKNIAF